MHWMVFFYCMAAPHSAACGDLSLTNEYLDQVSPTDSLSSPLHVTMFYLATGSKALMERRYNDAVAATQKSVDSMREDGGLFSQIHCQIVLSHALVEQGSFAQAEENNKEIEGLNAKHQSDITQFHTRMLRAYLNLRRGQPKAMLVHLNDALDVASQRELAIFHCGFRREVFAELCAIALQHQIHSRTAIQLIRNCNLPTPDSDSSSEYWPWFCRITTLGEMQIEIDGVPLNTAVITSKPRALLEVILALGGCNIIEEKISGVIWPDADGDAAHSAFSTTLYRLRKALGHYYREASQWLALVNVYSGALESAPFSENLYQGLMVAYAALGSQAEMVAIYQRCKNTLAAVLLTQPSTTTEALYLKLSSPQS